MANNDLAPTLVRWAGVEAPEVDGRSLTPAHRRPVDGWRGALLTEHPGTGKAPGHAALISRERAYIEWETGKQEFYDLRSAPYQLMNVAGSTPPDELKAMHEGFSKPSQPERGLMPGGRGTMLASLLLGTSLGRKSLSVRGDGPSDHSSLL